MNFTETAATIQYNTIQYKYLFETSVRYMKYTNDSLQIHSLQQTCNIKRQYKYTIYGSIYGRRS